MNSFKEVYSAMVHQDFAKEAEAQASQQIGVSVAGVNPELVKQAQDYDYIGRVMAHQVLGDLIKEAMDEEMPEASEDKKKAEADKLMAKARGEEAEEEEEEEDDEDEEKAEKKASVQAAILERMSHDPGYVSHLISKHYPR